MESFGGISIMTSISEAILEIKSDAQCSVSAEDVNQIIWHDGNPTNITAEAITAKVAEMTIRDAHIEPRQRAYPSIGDQMDMMWHDKQDDTTTWEDAVQAVKDAHSKP